MATLIKLTFPARAAASQPRTGSAKIIIFPGVRYERPAEAINEKPKRKRKTRAKPQKQTVIAR